jgi:hypothetical protein
MGFRASNTLLRAVELELFTKLETTGPQTAGELRRALGLHERTARDFLDALVELNFLEKKDGLYFNTRDASRFLDKRKPSYVGAILTMANHRLLGFWNDLTDGLSGDQVDEHQEAPGLDIETLYRDPERLAEFLASMTHVSRGANQTIARRFPWEEHETWLDLGCAQGDLVVQVVLANPHVRALGFDIAAVEPSFKQYVEAHGVSDHVTFIAGDLWTDVWPSVDVITMGHILSKWGLERRRILIRKAYEALHDDGVLIVYESLMREEGHEVTLGLLESLNMLVQTNDGQECFSGSECVEWLRDAGFERPEAQYLVGRDSMIVAYK